jgi:hypothetical protein
MTMYRKIIGLILLGLTATTSPLYAPNDTPASPLEIIRVPDYLFGSATYATPIKFRINGCDKAAISNISATFHWDGATKTINISGRFVAGDGTTQGNGTTNTYTAYVPSSYYTDVLVNSSPATYATANARYSLEVTYAPTRWGVTYPSTTSISNPSTGNISEKFADNRIHCTEIPVGTTGVDKYLATTSVTQQAAGTKAGTDEYKKFLHNGNSVNPPSVEPAPIGPFIWEVDIVESSVSGDTMRANCRFFDELDYNGGGSYYGYQARAYGITRAAYFYISYGGKTVAPLGSETVMDLSITSGRFDCELLSGSVFGDIVAVNNGGFNLSTAITGGLINLGWALGASWAPAWGTAATLFAAIVAADFDSTATDNNKAEGNALMFVGVADKTSHTSIDTAFSLSSTGLQSDIGIIGRSTTVGEQHFVGLTLSAGASAVSKPPWPGAWSDLEVHANVWYTASSATDFDDIKVTMKRN